MNLASPTVTQPESQRKAHAKTSGALFRGLLPYLMVVPAYAAHLLMAASSDHLKDDMFITLRYAYNLSHHGVLTWNIGQDPVDGYTSFLHTVLLSLSPVFNLTHLDFAIILNIILGLACLVLFVFLCIEIAALSHAELKETPVGSDSAIRDFSTPWAAILLGLSLLSIYRPFWFWQTALLEALLYTAVVLSSVAVTLRSIRLGRLQWWYPVLLLTVTLCRPEGIALTLGLVVMILASRWPKILNRGEVLSLVLLLVLPIVMFVGWRLSYYGHLFPNTYYAKLSRFQYQEIELGIEYMKGVMIYNGGILIAIPILNLIFEISRNTLTRPLFFLYMMPLCYVGVVIHSGGDVHQHARFWLPMTPICLACLVRIERITQALNLLHRNLLSWVYLVTIGLLCLYVTFTQCFAFENDYAPSFDRSRLFSPIHRAAQGFQAISDRRWPLWEDKDWGGIPVKRLAEVLPTSTSIAASDVGRLGYYAPSLFIYDLNSLNDPITSHLLEQDYVTWGKDSLEWTIENRSPEFVMSGFVRLSQLDSTNLTAAEILLAGNHRAYFPGATSTSMLSHVYPSESPYRPVGIPLAGRFVNLMAREDIFDEIQSWIELSKRRRWYQEDNSILIPGWDLIRIFGTTKPMSDNSIGQFTYSAVGVDAIELYRGSLRILLEARGDIADSIGPCAAIALLSADSAARAHNTVCIESTTWIIQDVEMVVPPGTYNLRITFINNSPVVNVDEDRNLFLRSVRIIAP